MPKVTEDPWDHQDPKVTRESKDSEASQASLARRVHLGLWVSLELRDQWARLAPMDSKVPEVKRVPWGRLGTVASQDFPETKESQVSQDPQDLRVNQAPPAWS